MRGIGRLVVLASLAALPAAAQSPVPPSATHTVQLTDQQIDGLINAGAACLEKVPYACAQYVIYVRDLVTRAREPKPPPPPAADPPK